jgi:hypothetical protein
VSILTECLSPFVFICHLLMLNDLLCLLSAPVPTLLSWCEVEGCP